MMVWDQVVLAAGRSSRMGFPKALVSVRGTTLIEAQIQAAIEAGAGEVFVVTGFHEARIRRRLGRVSDTLTFVRAPSRHGDQTRSLKTALQYRSKQKPLLMQLVDHPVIDPDTLRKIVPDRTDRDVRIPTYRGRRGHPPFFSTTFLEMVETMSPDRGINELYDRSETTVGEVAVEDPAVVVDLDTPSDLDRWRLSDRSRA